MVGSCYRSLILSTLPHSCKWQPLYLIRYSPLGLAVTVLFTEHPYRNEFTLVKTTNQKSCEIERGAKLKHEFHMSTRPMRWHTGKPANPTSPAKSRL